MTRWDSMNKGLKSVVLVTGSVGAVALAGWPLGLYANDASYPSSLPAVYRQSLDAVVNSEDNISSSNNSSDNVFNNLDHKTYVLDSLDLDAMSNSNQDKTQQTTAQKNAATKTTTSQASTQNTAQKVVTPQTAQVVTKTVYKGIEVNPVKIFPNAKLIGVDDKHMGYYNANGDVCTYFAKGFLFELDSSKIVSLIAPDYSYYTGQRYTIAYHTFKKGITVKTPQILSIFLGSELRPTLTETYNGRYDGVFVSGEIIKIR